ncbi:hypothetical protein AMECASPLE_037134 [Ameca splendens]|uniref:Uncharacterized protein n=1 Tax=Ameca splendens TaxID=208324 RepID=A0ABV0Y860_9TELE
MRTIAGTTAIPYREEQGRVPEEPPSRQCRSPKELQRQAHRPRRQLSTPEQIQAWTQRHETLEHITPKAVAQQSPGSRPQQAAKGSEPAHTKVPSPQTQRTTSTRAGGDTDYRQVMWQGGNRPHI